MSDFGRHMNPIAKKTYRCAHCNEQIEKGEKHYHFVGKWEGDFQNWRMHTECEVAYRVIQKDDPYAECGRGIYARGGTAEK